jgi:carboxyl-terminal processing protease
MQIETSEINTERFPKKHIRKFYLIFLIIIVFFAGVYVGQGRKGIGGDLPAIFVERNREAATKDVDWGLLWDTISQIEEKYVNRPPDKLKLLYGAVSGAVASLDDPYSVFLPPKEAQEFQNELKGNFEGIGAEIGIKNQQLTVVTPLEDSPAIKAGLKPGDFIYKINGEETANLTIEEAVSKIRGPAGTEVVLTIFRKSETKPREIKIVRAKIEVKSLSSEIRDGISGKKIGILKLRRFDQDTQGQIEKAISEFLLKDVKGVILDVRNNPGGYLDAAADVASNWLPEGQVVVIQRYGSETEEVYKAKGNNRLGGIPTVVLINGGSASASEIVAGALHDHEVAKLVGEKSFGKGSVQELVDLRGQAQLKLTIAKWLTPNGHDLNKEGLEPDVKVELTDDDFQNNRDPQLDKALEILGQ